MLNEVYRVLSPSGIFICVSHAVPAKREKYFKNVSPGDDIMCE